MAVSLQTRVPAGIEWLKIQGYKPCHIKDQTAGKTMAKRRSNISVSAAKIDFVAC